MKYIFKNTILRQKLVVFREAADIFGEKELFTVGERLFAASQKTTSFLENTVGR